MSSDREAFAQRVADAVLERAEQIIDVSHEVHAHPELALEESHAHRLLTGLLEREGFDVTRHAHDLETAFRASTGAEGGPEIVVCAEYDALPDIGHACGHNVIAAAAVGAGLALRPIADSLGARVTVLGTPAEEAIGGKALLVSRGAFEGVVAALMVHPAPLDIREAPALAVADLVVTVQGKAAHAAFGNGRKGNALDGLVSIHRMIGSRGYGDWERCHGVITDGGRVPNVVPERTIAHYFVRSRTLAEAEDLADRLRDEIATAAAESGCTVQIESAMERYREMKHNHVLSRLYEANAEALGREFVPQVLIGPESASSTDMGNVSQVVPSIHPMIGIDSGPHQPHQRGFASAAVSGAADQACLDAAIAMAHVVVDLCTDTELMPLVRADFETTNSTGDRPGGPGG